MYLPYSINDQGQRVYIESVGCGKTTLRCPVEASEGLNCYE